MCDFATLYKRSLRRHDQLVHSTGEGENDNINKLFFNEHCDFETYTRDKIREHTRRKHSNTVKRFNCHLWPYTTSGKGEIKTHLFQKHSTAIDTEMEDVARYKPIIFHLCDYIGLRPTELKTQLFSKHQIGTFKTSYNTNLSRKHEYGPKTTV